MFTIIVEKSSSKIIAFGFGELSYDSELQDKINLANDLAPLMIIDPNNHKQYYFVDNKIVDSIE